MPNDTGAATAQVADQGNAIDNLIASAFNIPTEVVEEQVEVETPAEIVEEPAAEQAEEVVEESEPVADEQSEATDEEAPETTSEYPTEDELFTRLPKSVPKWAVKEMATYAQNAKEGDELREAIGGDAFVAPMVKMSEALRTDGDDAALTFFQGLSEVGGDEAVMRVLGKSVEMAFVHGRMWQESSETKDFGDKLASLTNAAVEHRFNVPMDRLEVAAEWVADGSIDKFAEFLEKDFTDEDGDLDAYAMQEAAEQLHKELRAIRNDPVKQRLAKELAEAKRQVAKAPETPKIDDTQVTQAFRDYGAKAVEQVLADVVVSGNSPLKVLPTDSDEVKNTKQFFASTLASKMQAEFTKDELYPVLLNGFKLGQHTTSIYQTKLVQAMGRAIKAIDGDRKQGEALIAKAYKETRNAKLPPATKPVTPPATPTVTTDFSQQNGHKKSVADVEKDLAQLFR